MNFLLFNFISALLITSVTILMVGIFVLVKGWENKTNRVFAAYSFSIFWWTFFQALTNIVDKSSLAIYFSKLILVGAFFVPSLFVHFVVSFLELKKKEWIIRIAYFLSVFFGLLSVFTSYMVVGVAPRFFVKRFIVPGPVYKLAMIFLIICTIYGLYQLFRGMKKTKDTGKHNQLKYLFWSSLIGYAGGGSILFLVFGIYVPILNPFGIYFVGLYVIAVAYTILKYHLLDIRVVIKKALLYSFGIALVCGAIMSVSLLGGWLSDNIPGFKFWTVPLVAGFFAFIIGNIFWQKSKQIEKAYELEKHAHQELQHLSKIKDEFILTAQHHLRTPLSINKGYLDEILSKENQLDSKTKQYYLNKINASNDRLINLVNEFISITEMQMQENSLDVRVVNVKHLVEEILDEKSQEIKERNLTVGVNPSGKWPSARADAEKIRIVLGNLVDNAIKYTRNGHIKIEGMKKKKYVQISIEDSGVGISPREVKDIFSKYFERGKGANKVYASGKGIGLFIASNIIKSHGGEISVMSRGVGRGSKFIVKIPLA